MIINIPLMSELWEAHLSYARIVSTRTAPADCRGVERWPGSDRLKDSALWAMDH